jgi:hypothetical protein
MTQLVAVLETSRAGKTRCWRGASELVVYDLVG